MKIISRGEVARRPKPPDPGNGSAHRVGVIDALVGAAEGVGVHRVRVDCGTFHSGGGRRDVSREVERCAHDFLLIRFRADTMSVQTLIRDVQVNLTKIVFK